MKNRVVRLTEKDLEGLVTKILKESELNEIGIEPNYKKSDLFPAVGKDRNGNERLVIVDSDGMVQAEGPEMKYLRDKSKEEICRIADKLISQVFDLDEGLNEADSSDYTNIRKINFCYSR